MWPIHLTTAQPKALNFMTSFRLKIIFSYNKPIYARVQGSKFRNQLRNLCWVYFVRSQWEYFNNPFLWCLAHCVLHWYYADAMTGHGFLCAGNIKIRSNIMVFGVAANGIYLHDFIVFSERLRCFFYATYLRTNLLPILPISKAKMYLYFYEISIRNKYLILTYWTCIFEETLALKAINKILVFVLQDLPVYK